MDKVWSDALTQLGAQLEAESLPTPPTVPLKPADAYAAYRAAALRYSHIYSALETVYESTPNPQVRMAVGGVIELVLARLVTVRALAAKWHPTPPDLHGGGAAAPAAKPDPKAPTAAVAGRPFPWHFIDYDDVVDGAGAIECRVATLFFDAVRAASPLALPEDEPLVPGAPLSGTVAKTFLLDSAALRSARDALVESLNMLKLGVPRVAVEVEASARAAANAVHGNNVKMPREKAAAVLLAYERARLAVQSVAALRASAAAEQLVLARAMARRVSGGGDSADATADVSAAEEDDARSGGEGSDADADVMSKGIAATHIQRIGRGMLARRNADRMRDAEADFLGLRTSREDAARLAALEVLAGETVAVVTNRVTASVTQYGRSLGELPPLPAPDAAPSAPLGVATKLTGAVASVVRDDGAAMRDSRASTIQKWVVGYMAANPGKAPEGIAAYYADVDAKKKAAAEAAVAGGAAGPGGGGGAKAAPPPKGGDKGAAPIEPSDFPLALHAPVDWAVGVKAALAIQTSLLSSASVSGSRVDSLARDFVRPSVAAAIAREVDASMNELMKNIVAAQPKGKKDKKAKIKKVKEKKEKIKALPGEKFWERRMEKKKPVAEDLCSFLAEIRALNEPRKSATFDSYLSGPAPSSASRWSTDNAACRRRCDCVVSPSWAECAAHPTGVWMPPEPTYAQVREALMMTAVYPMGSLSIRSAVDAAALDLKLWRGNAPRSILLFGPHGVGKTHLAQAIANSLGALFVNVSVGNVEGKCLEKDGAAGILHGAFALAKDPTVGPVVIYIDEVEKMLPAGGAKGKKGADAGGAGGAARFKAVLPAYIASLSSSLTITGGVAATPESRSHHRAIVIGCSSEPDLGDPKLMDACFDVSVYVPPPDHGTRLLAWRTAIATHLREAIFKKSQRAMSTDPSNVDRERFERVTKDLGITNASAVPGAAGSAAFGAESSVHDALKGTPLARGFNALPLSDFAALATPSVEADVEAALPRLSVLAIASQGYTVGSIFSAVAATLTPARLDLAVGGAAPVPLLEVDFIPALAAEHKLTQTDATRLRKFLDLAAGHTAARSPPPVAAAGGGKKK